MAKTRTPAKRAEKEKPVHKSFEEYRQTYFPKATQDAKASRAAENPHQYGMELAQKALASM